MSPEQAKAKKVDQRSDIFSFGTVRRAHHRTQLFRGEHDAETLRMVVSGRIRAPGERRSTLPTAGAEKIVLKALQRGNEQALPAAASHGEDLEAYLEVAASSLRRGRNWQAAQTRAGSRLRAAPEGSAFALETSRRTGCRREPDGGDPAFANVPPARRRSRPGRASGSFTQ